MGPWNWLWIKWVRVKDYQDVAKGERQYDLGMA